jgi:hypothetical protein
VAVRAQKLGVRVPAGLLGGGAVKEIKDTRRRYAIKQYVRALSVRDALRLEPVDSIINIPR